MAGALGENVKVLIVDDEPSVVHALGLLLEVAREHAQQVLDQVEVSDAVLGGQLGRIGAHVLVDERGDDRGPLLPCHPEPPASHVTVRDEEVWGMERNVGSRPMS